MFAENFHRHDTNMNMNMPSRLTAILLLTAVSALCASASSRDLKGKVTDPSGTPVESALVVLMSGTGSTPSMTSGLWRQRPYTSMTSRTAAS